MRCVSVRVIGGVKGGGEAPEPHPVVAMIERSAQLEQLVVLDSAHRVLVGPEDRAVREALSTAPDTRLIVGLRAGEEVAHHLEIFVAASAHLRVDNLQYSYAQEE